MDVQVRINKLPCSHVIVDYISGEKIIRRVYTIDALKDMLNPDSLDQVEMLLLGQIKKVIADNPTAAMSQLKTIIEGMVFKV
jgi:hypothetical protein